MVRTHGRCETSSRLHGKAPYGHWKTLRKAAERSVDAVCKRIGNILDSISTQECENYIRNRGYA
jgi:hypothetical protein